MMQMSGLEMVGRMVRAGSIVALLVIVWLTQGGEKFIVMSTPISDLLTHMLIFCFLAGASLIGWADHARRIFLGLLALAILLELAQILLPNRSFTYFDLAGNIFGVLLGAAFFVILRKFSRRIGP